MTDKKKERRKIEIPEIVRVEGHAAVFVDIVDNRVTDVKLDVFEGTRFFERLVVGHPMSEIPHITSRVCAICSTGHVLAAISSVEKINGFKAPEIVELFRELMHLGMIIESNATHIFALALPDFLGFEDVYTFATEHKNEFTTWTNLRNLGAKIQTVIGGRPFHPVNLQAGGFSSYPSGESINELKLLLDAHKQEAIDTSEMLMKFNPPVKRTSEPVFLALYNPCDHYSYFGEHVRSSDGLEASVDDYRTYLKEETVEHSHAKRSSLSGQPIMVGSMARLHFFNDRLSEESSLLYADSAMASGDTNTIWNNLSQAIEIVEAFERAQAIIRLLDSISKQWLPEGDSGAFRLRSGLTRLTPRSGAAVGAVECPRGTLYHEYSLDEKGMIVEANMITPSAQNTYRIERDIQEIVTQSLDNNLDSKQKEKLSANLETLVRAYDPCNTCATHMVQVKFAD